MEAGMMASMFRRLNPSIPLLAISGHSEDERAFNAGRLPVEGFLQKPFTVEALCRGVHQILVQRPSAVSESSRLSDARN
jgi:DNA-binding NtrC family response regulator